MMVERCIDPNQVETDDYMTYLDGEIRPGFAQHLEKCLYCKNEVTAFNTVEDSLAQNLRPTKPAYRANCLDSLIIGQYSLGLLKGQQFKGVEAHLATCKYCNEECEQFKNWAEEERVAAEKKVDDKTMLEQSHNKPAHIKKWLGSVVATVLNVHPATTGFALRGSKDTPVAYRAEDILIKVRVQNTNEHMLDLQVVGEIMQADESTPLDLNQAEARLVYDREVLATEAVDEIGSFFFDKVKPVNFDLEIQLPDRIVLIPNLNQSKL